MANNFIVLDLETSGLSPVRHSMLSLGAVDFATGKEFYGECRAYVNREVCRGALEVNGFTLDQIEDKKKPLPHELYLQFVEWVRQNQLEKTLAGHNIGSFDVGFLKQIHESYKEYYPAEFGEWPFGHRFIDLHSVFFAKYGRSLKMDEILQTLGLPSEPKPHNALTGAKCERDAFKILLN